MTKSKTSNMDTLRDVLERFGANAKRWPQDKRVALEELIQSQDKARALFDEFKDLDHLLDQQGGAHAELAPARHEALAARILNAVSEDTDNTVERDNVVPFQPSRVQPAVGQRPAHRIHLPNVAAAGALAASLMLGIVLGSMGTVDQTWIPVSEALGLNSASSDVAALSDPIFDAVDSHTFEDDLL